MAFPNVIHGSEGDQFVSYSTQPQIRLGAQLVLDDGRKFRFCLNGATAMTPGFLYQSPVPANQSGRAVDTYAAGVSALSVTFGAAVTANQYADGFVWMDLNANGVSTMYRIKSHLAGTTVTLNLWAPTNEAILAASTVSAIQSPYRSVVVHASPPSAMLVGVAVYAVPAANYGWVQTHGPCAVMNDTATVDAAIGKLLMASADRDGEVCGYTAGGDDEIIVGQCIQDEADAEFLGAFLTLE